jgi:hypothetical protein
MDAFARWPVRLLACSRSTSKIMFASTEVARDAQRLRVCVDDDHGVDAILVTLPAIVLNGLAGSILARRHQISNTFNTSSP